MIFRKLFRKKPKAAIRIERSAFGQVRPTAYVVDILDNVKGMIQHMQEEPQFFIDRHHEENLWFDKDKIKFSVTEITDEFIEDDGNEVPVIAVAKYNYRYKDRTIKFPIELVIIPLVIVAIIVPLIFFGGAIADKGNEMLEAAQTPCTLFVKNGVPDHVMVMGETLTYGPDKKVDPIWEGTATYDMLQMAYNPINRGCEVIHLDEKGNPQ